MTDFTHKPTITGARILLRPIVADDRIDLAVVERATGRWLGEVVVMNWICV